MKTDSTSSRETLINLQGHVLGLKAVLNAIVVANPGLRIEDHQIGRAIILTKGVVVDDSLVSKKAREVAQETIGRCL